MKLEYIGKEPIELVGGVKPTSFKRGGILELPDKLGEQWLKRYPDKWKKVKEKPIKPSKEGDE